MQTTVLSKIYPIPKHPSYYDPSQSGVGIDFGTTRCYTAVNKNNRIDVIAIDNNHRHLASYVGCEEKKPKCGGIVMERMRNFLQHAVYDIKRIIGKPYNSIAIDPYWPFEVLNINGKVKIKTKDFNGSDFLLSPERILSILMKHMKHKVEEHKQEILSEAVITVPMYFSQSQIDATIESAALAGWEVPHILPEPIAACFNYATENKIHENSNVLIFDLGGGTLDICIIHVENKHLHILGSSSDFYLGGRNFDTLLMNHFTSILKEKYNIDIEGSNIKKYKLLLKCEEIKQDLEAEESATLNVDEIDCSCDSNITVTKEEFKKLSAEILIRINHKIRETLDNLKISIDDINYVLQVGGGCRMAMVKELLKNVFPNSQHCCEDNPDWTIAYGASLYCCGLQNHVDEVVDKKPSPKLVKKEITVSPSVAIELTSKSVTAFFDDEFSKRSFDKVVDFNNLKSFKFLGNELFFLIHGLTLPDRVRERKDTFWTIGIPDNANQKARKEIKKAFEKFRRLSLKSPENQDLADTKDDKTENESDTLNLPPPPIRLINHSTAAAISYLQSLRDQERAENESEGDIEPILPYRHFLTIFVSGYQVYGAEFETIDGLVQQKRSLEFKDEDFKSIIKQVKKEDEEKNLIPALNNLWTVIHADLISTSCSIRGKVYEMYRSPPPVLFTYNKKSYLIKKSGVEEIPPKYYITPPDKFSLFPSINNIRQDWGHGFILKGINVKTRMLAGDADMIDYDVPSAFVGYATIECKDKFRATLIRDGEKLPIHRTIFEAEKPIPFLVKIGVQSVTTHEGIRQNFVCIVDENGIFLSEFN